MGGKVCNLNDEHKHSQLNFVSPGQRHALQDGAILAKRMLEAAKPMRWSTEIRNCEAVGAVTLNPDKAPEEGVINAAIFKQRVTTILKNTDRAKAKSKGERCKGQMVNAGA
ncbi:hypothetical protein GCM10025855_41880 [Shewanella glacialipiscicola]|uniref:Uncharacterized protein n=1 Tax=Shewanella glacialipiscicola TaxID=614069 RepID=A0ABQ6J906_9GAMM|nr:hypothetical protein GCM10025855_41880 [Shewanella glacialipiscicola]